MYIDRRSLLTLACVLMSISKEAGGAESRELRSIYDGVYRPRGNSIRIDGRDYDGGYSGERSNLPIRNSVEIYEPAKKIESAEIPEDDEKLLDAIVSNNYDVVTASDLDKFDRIGDRIIAGANITEDAKRVVRQVKRQRPGFFWTLFRVAFETVNETRSAVQQISDIVESNFVPETTTIRGRANANLTSVTTTTVAPSNTNSTERTTTTTPEPFKFTRTDFQGLVRRNLRGLIRLFNIEWQDAINQSRANVQEFQKNLENQVSPFLQDNPEVV